MSDWTSKIVDRWWGCMLLGVVVLGVTYMQYRDLVKMESGETEHVYISRRTKILYDLGGKTTCAVVGGLISLPLFGFGVYQLVSKKPSPPGR